MDLQAGVIRIPVSSAPEVKEQPDDQQEKTAPRADAAEKVEALLQSLVIKERPTPDETPAPPSFSVPSLSFPAAALGTSKKEAKPSKTPPTPATRSAEIGPKTYSSTAERERARRQFNSTSSLVPGLPDLSAELIQSSKVLALAGAGEESDDEHEPEMEQWEKDMDEAGRVEDDEMKELFAQAYEARDLV